MNVVYDAGVLIAADGGDREVWAEHRVRLELGVVPVTTAPVVAQVSRSPQQAQLHRLLRGCEIVPFAAGEAREVGSLLARAATADVVDAHLPLTASRTGAIVITSDPADLGRLSGSLSAPVPVERLRRRR